MNPVRVRFAPSPTGFFHIGSARTALFNWLYARHTGGKFILRVEDTDKERNTEDSLQLLMDGMRWLGMDWDEGPEVGGDFGPYFQSQRADIYNEYLEKLKAKDLVYQEDGATLFRVSEKPQVIQDSVRGRVERLEEKDFVIFRSNGTPVFHFVNVVDDITMGITHIIRGEDHLSNSSKHAELFKAYDAEIPQYAHIPLILKSSGPGKMSKRDEGALIQEYQTRGFLPAAVVNYLCLLGWSPKDNREVLDIQEVIKLFDLPGIIKNNAKFDEKKLAHINTEYLRKLPIEQLTELSKPILKEHSIINSDTNDDYLKKVLSIAQEKINSLDNLPSFLNYFFTDTYTSDEKVKGKIFKKGSPIDRMKELLEVLKTLEDFSVESIQSNLENLMKEKGTKPGEYMLTARYAVSGQGMGPSFYGVLETLGKEKVTNRISQFIEKN